VRGRAARRVLPALAGAAGIAAFLGWIAWNTQAGERLPRNHSLGWDGTTYAAIASDPFGWILTRRIDSYSFERVFPCLLAYVAARALGLPLAMKATYVRAFAVLNLLVIAAAVAAWWRLARAWAGGDPGGP